MIKALEVRNFKSVKHLVLDCRRVNVFIGKPNTGKSNILEVIGFLSHIYFRKLTSFVRLENMMNLFYDQDLGEEILIRTTTESGTISVHVQFRSGEFLVLEAKGEGGKSLLLSYDYRAKELVTTSEDTRKEFAIFKFYRFRVRSDFPSKKPGPLLPPDGDNLLTVLMTNKELKKLIRNLLGEYGLRLVLKPVENKIEVEKEYEDIVISYPYSLISDTLQRVILHLAAIETNEGSVIAFEEPEAHSFPYYTKFLAERIALDKRNQYFISTHNPYFLLSLIEKTPLEDIAVYVTYYQNHQTKIKKLGKDELERILEMELDVFFNIEDLSEGVQ